MTDERDESGGTGLDEGSGETDTEAHGVRGQFAVEPSDDDVEGHGLAYEHQGGRDAASNAKDEDDVEGHRNYYSDRRLKHGIVPVEW